MNYILQLPSEKQKHFTGWPDFTITETTSRHVRRFRTKGIIKGIGETQSPPGVTKRTKTETIAQTRVYACGQFIKLRLATATTKKIAVVILFKDKTVQVALPTLIAGCGKVPNSIGQVQYKVVECVDPTDL